MNYVRLQSRTGGNSNVSWMKKKTPVKSALLLRTQPVVDCEFEIG